MNIGDVVALLARAPISAADEHEIQGAIERVLVGAGLGVDREVQLGTAGRIDFEVPALRLGIEVKVKGGAKDVVEQLARYAETGRYDAVLLVTTQRRHRVPATLCGVPIFICHMWGAIL